MVDGLEMVYMFPLGVHVSRTMLTQEPLFIVNYYGSSISIESSPRISILPKVNVKRELYLRTGFDHSFDEIVIGERTVLNI